jgi:membrane-bound serine protease (ClpP class)
MAIQWAMIWVQRLVLACALLVGGSLHAQPQAAPTNAPSVIVAELDGIIHPIAAEYLTGVIDDADAAQASLVVLILRTPGGLLESTRTIVSRMIASHAPVVVFVGPSGARAASAGFVLTIAADIAAMAPGTHIGAAHPVSGTGQQMDETMAKKAAADTAAYVRSLAEARDRNVMLAEQAVLESRAFTDVEAARATPPLVDVVAHDVNDLLRQLDGRRIKRFDGRMVTLHTRDASRIPVSMTRRQQFLGAIADPQIAYLLLMLGTLGLTIELWNPGAVVPGVAGGLSLLLAFFAFQILSVNVSGVLLILFGFGLIVLELKVPSFGALGIGGSISLLIGSLMVTRTVPGVGVGLDVIVPVVAVLSVGILLLGRLGLAAQRQPAVMGAGAIIGQRAVARTAFAPGVRAMVDMRGELWQARSESPIDAGASVRVTEVNGLTLTVVPDESPNDGGDRPWKA